MSESFLLVTAVVSFALVHAASSRRFPAGERWWKRLASPLGDARKTLHALALAVLLVGAWAGGRTLDGVDVALVLSVAVLSAGSAMVLSAGLWPRVTWYVCAACAAAWPLLLLVQVLHG